MNIAEKVKQKIENALPGSDVSVHDESAGHADHEPGAHLEVSVTYAGFEGKPLLAQHRMITEILRDELQGIVHALRLHTKVK